MSKLATRAMPPGCPEGEHAGSSIVGANRT
ncbi:hypothetical protein QFZ94_004530 [Paraburkholderia sp. JPY465]